MSFLYTLPGITRPVVKRFEFPFHRHNVKGAGFVAVLAFITGIGFLLLHSESADATAVGAFESHDGALTPQQMEEKSDEMKLKIVALDENAQEEGEGGSSFYTYRVKQGDTLSEIAGRVGVRVDHIAASSGITEFSTIKPGQKLTIPEKKGVLYEVKKGDSLAKVAQYYSVKLAAVYASNSETLDPDLIVPGTKVFLPNAKVPIVNPTWRMPVRGRLTSRFGYRRHPLYRYRQFHSGIDIRARYTSVYAARSGTVLFAGKLGTYGNAVIIRHPSGFKTLYAHLSRVLVRAGTRVKGGRRIAISGNTGMSTGPHLHFEIIKNGKPINPLRYVK